MQPNLTPATAVVKRATSVPATSSEAHAARSVEQARSAYLSRRFRFDRGLAAVVAHVAFGEARGQ